MTIYSSNQLLQKCSIPATNENIAIAHIILKIYNSAKNFYQDDMIQCMKEYNNTKTLNFNKYNIQF